MLEFEILFSIFSIIGITINAFILAKILNCRDIKKENKELKETILKENSLYKRVCEDNKAYKAIIAEYEKVMERLIDYEQVCKNSKINMQKTED